MVTNEQWLAAQKAERRFHNESFDVGRAHYAQTYEQYFAHLGIESDLGGRTVAEIGPADFSALSYCRNVGSDSIIVEPMASEFLRRTSLRIIAEPAEDLCYWVDEVWLLNVLQHVIDPFRIVERAKRQSSVIRFFEPINGGFNECHPWNLTIDMLTGWFGDSVIYYPPNPMARKFHASECAYGVYYTGISRTKPSQVTSQMHPIEPRWI